MGMNQLPLPSGLCVRYEKLLPKVVDQIKESVASELGKNASMLAFGRGVGRMGARSMVRYVSAEKLPVLGSFSSKEQRDAYAAKKKELFEAKIDSPLWKPYTYDALEAVWSELFDPKDDDTLVNLYSKFHTVSQNELEEIMGKEESVPTT